ncbi:MAG: ThiF family adenylyltransferase [Chitinispirillales bacterium]|nr:ThiF family adenylyltransferase [Chitinispirillales bacterium]
MTSAHDRPFGRLELLVGSGCLRALADARVAVFGVGGVGSWCAEGLVRSGIGRLAIVDSDDVSASNINRQLPATPATVGRPKVEAMGERLREINPAAEIAALRRVYNWETKGEFDLSGYDYVIDAIDSLSSKVELIINAAAAGATVFSALGAACKVDPARMRVSSIWESERCKLGRFVRKRLRRRGFKGDFLCVWSDEQKFGCGVDGDDVDDDCIDDDGIDSNDNNIAAAGNNIAADNNAIVNDNNRTTNKTINGSLVCVTGVFGFTLSGLVVQDVINKTKTE